MAFDGSLLQLHANFNELSEIRSDKPFRLRSFPLLLQHQSHLFFAHHCCRLSYLRCCDRQSVILYSFNTLQRVTNDYDMFTETKDRCRR